MPKVDKAKFEETLRTDAAWQGQRCAEARNSDNGDVIACAIAVSQMVYLRSLAAHKPLTDRDIQIAIDAFTAAAGMEEKRTAMGGIEYARKAESTSPTPQPFSGERVLLANLRVGDTFTFEGGGAVYVRSRGGYRPGRGGELVKHSADQRVYRYA